MIKIIHRINTVAELKKIPTSFGVEIDVRFDNSSNELYLSHNLEKGENLEEYLKEFHHSFIVFNIKEAGTEQMCLDLAKKYTIPRENYFLLDVEFPYLFCASRKAGIKEIAVRFSEAEPIEFAMAQKSFVSWVWIDTNTELPLTSHNVTQLKQFKTCLVSPDRWGRPEDIVVYQKQMTQMNFQLDAVMVGKEYVNLWDPGLI